MGGAAGHIKQIWEATDLTFKDLRKLVYASLEGSLENVSEKLDGQNILITYKNSKALCARTNDQIEDFGERAMDIEMTKNYFSERGNPDSVEKAFVNVVKDFDKLFNDLPIMFSNIFENGKFWLNVEILSIENENVIPYFKDQLRIHHLIEVDVNGNKIKTINLVFNPKQMETFLICKTNEVRMGRVDEITKNELMSQFEHLIQGFDDDDTIGDFMQNEMYHYIFNNIPDSDRFNENSDFAINLAKRWGKGIKDPNITSLLRYESYDNSEWVRAKDKNIKSTYDILLHPFVLFFSKLGVAVLKNIKGLATANEEVALSKIKEKVNEAIANVGYVGLEKHIDLLNELNGSESIVPTEGIVFEFNGELLKLTGSFTPILRIIGTHRFGS